MLFDYNILKLTTKVIQMSRGGGRKTLVYFVEARKHFKKNRYERRTA